MLYHPAHPAWDCGVRMLQAPPALQVLLLALALSLWLRLLVAVLSVLRLLAGVRMALLQTARLCPGCSSRPRCARCICVRRRSAIVDGILGRTVCACWLRVVSCFSWLEDPPLALALCRFSSLANSSAACTTPAHLHRRGASACTVLG
jgi:hypothetical protein